MKRTTLYLLLTYIAGLVIAFSAFSCIKNVFLANATAFILDVSGVILLSYVSLKVKNFKKCWIGVLVMVIFYTLGDVTWVLTDLKGLDPSTSLLPAALYTVSNLSLMVSVLSYFMYKRKSFDTDLLFIDVTTIALTSILIFLSLSRFETISELLILDYWAWINFLAVSANFLTISTMVVLMISNSMTCFPCMFRFMIIGILIYIGVDFAYYFEWIYGVYTPFEYIDIFYMAAIGLIICSGLIEIYDPARGSQQVVMNQFINRNISHRIHSLFLVPILLTYLKGFNWIIIISFLGILGIRQLLIYNFNAFKNRILLDAEKTLNQKLEEMIEENTKQLVETNYQLDMLSKQDDLTGLFNRRYFLERYQSMLEKHEDGISPIREMVLFYIDLDHFQAVNDSFGHDIGDLVLIEISNRLKAWRPDERLIARMGGDEFVVIFENALSKEQIEEIAQELVDLCCQRVHISLYQFTPSASLGISRYPQDGTTLSLLMRHADMAMYHSKDMSRGSFQFYTESLSDGIERRHNIQLALKSANFDEEFEIYYQGQFSIPERRLVGVEALLRWNNPELGAISPAEFIPLSEETGMIIPIGEWVLKTAMNQVRIWNLEHGQSLRVGINISPIQLEAADFIANMESTMRNLQIKPEWLDLEITENSAMETDAGVEKLLTVMSELGCSVSIDDFGTGYSSLSYIKRYDIDRIKIAKELIDEIVTDINSEKIVHAIILMSKGLELATIAEGVETEEQLQKLIELGCEEVQGYLLGRPMPAELFEKSFLNLN